MFSNRDGIHIPVSGGTPWVQVPMNSNYPSQEIWQDGNKYAPLSEVNRPRPSAPVAYTGNRDINTELSIQRYQQGYARREELEEQERRQQEALINKQLDIAASTQQNEMDKLYIQGGLDEMRKEYYRVSAGSEGPYSVYAKAAYKVLCAKEKEEAPIREETTKSANNYYNEGGIDNLKYLINFYKSRGEFNYASVAQSLLNAKEKEEAINTPAVTKGANEYYATGGMASLKHLVNSYKDSNDFVNYNIAKRILKQKEEEEHNRRMQQDTEYAESYKIKEAENEICKLEKEIAEQKKIDPFYGQPSSAAINERRKAFEHSKSLGYEGARAYLAELSLPANARFEHSKIGAAVALQNYFDKVIPLQNKIEQAKAKIQEIESARIERIEEVVKKIDGINSPRRMLKLYDTINAKTKKLTELGDVQAKDWENLAKRAQEKHQIVNDQKNTLGVVILERDCNSLVSPGHGLVYIKDHNGNITYYENIPGGARQLTPQQYLDTYSHRASLTKEMSLNQTQHNNTMDYINERLIENKTYIPVTNDCISLVQGAVEAANKEVTLKDMFSVEALEKIEVDGLFRGRIYPEAAQYRPQQRY